MPTNDTTARLRDHDTVYAWEQPRPTPRDRDPAPRPLLVGLFDPAGYAAGREDGFARSGHTAAQELAAIADTYGDPAQDETGSDADLRLRTTVRYGGRPRDIVYSTAPPDTDDPTGILDRWTALLRGD